MHIPFWVTGVRELLLMILLYTFEGVKTIVFYRYPSNTFMLIGLIVVVHYEPAQLSPDGETWSF